MTGMRALPFLRAVIHRRRTEQEIDEELPLLEERIMDPCAAACRA